MPMNARATIVLIIGHQKRRISGGSNGYACRYNYDSIMRRQALRAEQVRSSTALIMLSVLNLILLQGGFADDTAGSELGRSISWILKSVGISMPNRLCDGARFETARAHRRTGILFIVRYIGIYLAQ